MSPHEHRSLHEAAELDGVSWVLTLLFTILKSFEDVVTDEILAISYTYVVKKLALRTFLVFRI